MPVISNRLFPKPIKSNHDVDRLCSTLVVLRALIIAETKPFYDRAFQKRASFFGLVVGIGISAFLAAILLLMTLALTIQFEISVLRPVDRAVADLSSNVEDSGVTAHTISNFFQIFLRALQVFAGILAVTQLSLIVTVFMRNGVRLAIAFTVLLGIGFWFFFCAFSLVTILLNTEQIASTYLGAVFESDLAAHPSGRAVHVLQSELGCCGLSGYEDWSTTVMATVPRLDTSKGLNASRVRNSGRWQETCQPSDTCLAPISCCSSPVSARCNVKNAHAGIHKNGCVKTLAESFDTFRTKIVILASALVILVGFEVLGLIVIFGATNGVGVVHPGQGVVQEDFLLADYLSSFSKDSDGQKKKAAPNWTIDDDGCLIGALLDDLAFFTSLQSGQFDASAFDPRSAAFILSTKSRDGA